MKKNTAGQKITVFAFNTTTALPVTADAANITADVSLDDSTPVSVIDVNPTEISGGYYSFDVTQAETNADKLHIIAASTSSNVVVIGDPSSVIYTTTTAAGAGATEAILNLKDSAAAIVADADVRIRATNDTSAAVVASGRTDSFGNVTFYLDAGTYYRWAEKASTNFTNPQSFTVT